MTTSVNSNHLPAREYLHIILIKADDLGYGDVELNENIRTPKIDPAAARKHIWFWMEPFTTSNTEVPQINWVWFQDGPKPTARVALQRGDRRVAKRGLAGRVMDAGREPSVPHIRRIETFAAGLHVALKHFARRAIEPAILQPELLQARVIEHEVQL
ncbi:MAG: hypothetical protein ACREIA_12175, partial [Opitutaceae bacterium]